MKWGGNVKPYETCNNCVHWHNIDSFFGKCEMMDKTVTEETAKDCSYFEQEGEDEE
jgi:hypothetical protein